MTSMTPKTPKTRPGNRIRRLLARVCDSATLARIVDPIVADMQHEHADALREDRVWKSRWVRLAGHVALLKAMALYDSPTAATSAARRMIAYAIVITVAVTMLFAVPPMLALAPQTTGAANRLALVIRLVPQAVPIAIPIGVTLGMLAGLGSAALSRRSTRAMLVIAMVSSIASFVLMGWLVPAANIAFLELLTGRHVVKGVSELTLGELYQRMVHAPTGVRYLATMFHTRIAFSCATLVLGLFALAVRHWRPLVRVSLGVVACALYVGYYFLLADPIRSGMGGAFPPIVMVWLPNVAMIAIATLLALLARVQRERQGMNL